MSARFYVDTPLDSGAALSLPEAAARHVQVLRLQPGDSIRLFNGRGNEGEFDATIEHMGRSDVQVIVGSHTATQREAQRALHLAVGMPANERMDWLVEKATELGAASIQPLLSERSVLRLKGERADKKLAHWRGIAQAACEQCGRNRVPVMHGVVTLAEWLQGDHPAVKTASPDSPHGRMMLSLQHGARPLQQVLQTSPGAGALTFLSGPEGGLSPAEEASALALGFAAVSLGPRVLRAETAPLACLALLGLSVQ